MAVILEDIRAQFKVFGEGLQMLNEKVNNIDQKLDTHIEENRRQFDQNQQEHQLIMQMIKELNEEQSKLKRAK